MDTYIRGWRQFKALYIAVEQSWIFLLGRDAIYGRRVRIDRIKCIKRELEIFFGLAKPYKVVFAPSFWESLRELGINDVLIEELKEKYKNDG